MDMKKVNSLAFSLTGGAELWRRDRSCVDEDCASVAIRAFPITQIFRKCNNEGSIVDQEISPPSLLASNFLATLLLISSDQTCSHLLEHSLCGIVVHQSLLLIQQASDDKFEFWGQHLRQDLLLSAAQDESRQEALELRLCEHD